MTENRLELLDRDLSTLLQKASVSQQRNAALIASQFALERTSLNDPIVAQGAKLRSCTIPKIRLRINSQANS